MSEAKIVDVTCPHCRNAAKFEMWEIINTSQEKDMQKAVRKGFIPFTFMCPACKKPTSVFYPCLYHQPDIKLMIQTGPKKENSEYSKMLKYVISANKQMAGYTLRITNSVNEFKEKLAIFDAGLDDRIMEILKVMYLRSPGASERVKAADEVLFANFPEKGKQFEFYKDGALLASAPFIEKFYQEIANHYTPLLAMMPVNYVFNKEWAISLMGRK